MTEKEKLIAAVRKLAEENATLRQQIAQHEQLVTHALDCVVTGLVERIDAIESAHQKAVVGFNEVLAGHEIALLGLGAEPEPVRRVEEPVTVHDTEPVPAEDGAPAPPHFVERLHEAKAAAIRLQAPTFAHEEYDVEGYETCEQHYERVRWQG